MTMVEITAIIATGILGVLCIICIASVVRNERQAKKNSKVIQDIEKSLSSFGDSIKEQTQQLIEQIEKQTSRGHDEPRPELPEDGIERLTGAEEAPAAAEVTAEEAGAITETSEPEEIEELDDEIELDDLFRELNAMTEAKQEQIQPQIPAEPAPQPKPQPEPEPEIIEAAEERRPSRYHQGYNIGRSGRKYTAEELNVLIRE